MVAAKNGTIYSVNEHAGRAPREHSRRAEASWETSQDFLHLLAGEEGRFRSRGEDGQPREGIINDADLLRARSAGGENYSLTFNSDVERVT
jgi:hypothetical protein